MVVVVDGMVVVTTTVTGTMIFVRRYYIFVDGDASLTFRPNRTSLPPVRGVQPQALPFRSFEQAISAMRQLKASRIVTHFAASPALHARCRNSLLHRVARRQRQPGMPPPPPPHCIFHACTRVRLHADVQVSPRRE
jgi:hypothetical protein